MKKKTIIKIHYVIFAPLLIGSIILLFEYPSGFLSKEILFFVFFYSMAVGMPFIILQQVIENIIERKMPWLKTPLKRLIITVTTKIILLISIVLVVHYIYYILILGKDFMELYNQTYIAFKYVVATLVVALVIESCIRFFKNWRQAAINEEVLKREKLAIEYEALRNQVNPHFMYNSLTSLATLVHKDPDKAVKFISEFANVYRNVLDTSDKELVDLKSELNFMNSIIYLYSIRYEEGLKISNKIPATSDFYIIPMALQLLLENAVKHNIVSKNDPLTIEMWVENDYVCMKNNIQLKISTVPSGNVGLKNIQSRYKYFTDKKVIIENMNSYFTVKLPLLIIQK